MEPERSTAQVLQHPVRATDELAHAAVRAMLQYVGEDTEREGLVDTPKRVAKAWREMTEGYRQSPADILSRVFTEQTSEMILVTGIEFVSLCEHHCLPFTGRAHVAYIPKDGRIVGLSKLARLVHCFARRLQVQERLTRQIVEAIQTHLDPLGSACIIEASHSCMAMRGIRTPASMVTSALEGVFMKPEVREEFFSLVRRG